MRQEFIRLVRWCLTGMLAAFATCIAAQDYPSKPIRVIVGLSAGGSVDSTARLVGTKLTERWGQPIIVDNRPGGMGIIAGTALVNSSPDGYTLQVSASTLVIAPLLVKAPYDVIKDFAPVASLTKNESILVVHPSVPAHSWKDFLALAKAKPGGLTYATPGTGGVSHLAAEMLFILAGIKLQHVPYKGGGQIISDLVGGHVQVYFSPPPTVLPHILAGRLRGLAISGENRMAAVPQLPTFTEAGLPGLDVKYWSGMFAPAGTPRAIINKLSGEIGRILSLPEIRDKLLSRGMEIFYTPADHFSELVKADMSKYDQVIKRANIRITK